MKLSAHEAFLFFKLMIPLQFFVQKKLGVLENIETFEDYKNTSFGEKFKVRNSLFDNIHLIDEFIDENPHDIPLKELAVCASWKRFIKGEFYIERHLKTSTIFIGEDDKVYSVIGLTDSLEKIFPKYLIPQISFAILLPFQHKIVADGFFSANQMYLGGNIKTDLKNIYNRAKKIGSIVIEI
jgi:hypothetical protein